MLKIILLAMLFPGLGCAETINGRVVSIADGDTLTILDSSNRQHKVRIGGIDAPERTQDFGERSKSHLAAMAFSQQVTADCPKSDRYGRLVCKVTVSGNDVGLAQVRTGMAWWYREYSKEQSPEERTAYEQAEFQAKIHRDGLWDSKNPTPPWERRRAK